VDEGSWWRVARLCRTGVAAPVTTSVGRLFDAVSALCGVRARTSYEGQAAIELEGAATAGEEDAYPLPAVQAEEGPEAPTVLDARESVRAVVADLAAGITAPIVAARFHNGLADATARALAAEADRRGVATAVLSGGVFANRRLLERTSAALERAGLRVLVPERLPPGDGGVSFGQAAIAAARTAGR
jgi:hydrogenase maturation protein HypF